MLSQEELNAMVEAEEKRLGVGSEEFLRRHHEIMEMIDNAQKKGVSKNGKTVYNGSRSGGNHGCI